MNIKETMFNIKKQWKRCIPDNAILKPATSLLQLRAWTLLCDTTTTAAITAQVQNPDFVI